MATNGETGNSDTRGWRDAWGRATLRFGTWIDENRRALQWCSSSLLLGGLSVLAVRSRAFRRATQALDLRPGQRLRVAPLNWADVIAQAPIQLHVLHLPPARTLLIGSPRTVDPDQALTVQLVGVRASADARPPPLPRHSLRLTVLSTDSFATVSARRAWLPSSDLSLVFLRSRTVELAANDAALKTRPWLSRRLHRAAAWGALWDERAGWVKRSAAAHDWILSWWKSPHKYVHLSPRQQSL